MSRKSHYKHQVGGLQYDLNTKKQELFQLLHSTDELRQKEQALQMCIAQAVSGVEAVRDYALLKQLAENERSSASWVVAALCKRVKEGRLSAATGPPCLASYIQAAIEAMTNNRVSNASQPVMPGSSVELERQQTANAATLEVSARSGYSLWCIVAELELHIQTALYHGQCPQAPASDLYTSTIINKLFQNTRRLQQLSAMSARELCYHWSEAVKQFGYLLPRYDTALPAEFNWNPKQQLDHLVEAQVEMTLAQGFAGRPRANVELLMFNLNTGKQETCPEDWWKHVVQVMVEDTEQESLFGPWFAKHKQGARAQAVTGRTLQSMSHADSNTMHAYLLQHILGGHIGSLQIGCKQSASNNNSNSKKIDDCTGAFQLLTVHPELAFECWSSEQQELEERMSDLMGKMSVLLFMHEMQMINLLSKKQLALAAVHSYPYCFSAFSVCLALNQMEWFNKQDKAQDKHQVLPRTDQNDVAGTDDGVDDDDDDDDD